MNWSVQILSRFRLGYTQTLVVIMKISMLVAILILRRKSQSTEAGSGATIIGGKMPPITATERVITSYCRTAVVITT